MPNEFEEDKFFNEEINVIFLDYTNKLEELAKYSLVLRVPNLHLNHINKQISRFFNSSLQQLALNFRQKLLKNPEIEKD